MTMGPRGRARVAGLALGLLAAAAASATETEGGRDPSTPAAAPGAASKFRSSDDGWLDISGFLDEAYGFVPLVIPITEPAVGYGAAGALVFIDKPEGESAAGFGRPNLTAAGGLRTENGTRGRMAGDLRHWMNDRLQSLAGAVDASVNLDFYGIGRDDALQASPLRYSIDITGGGVRLEHRVGDSRVWLGLGYGLAMTKVSFATPPPASALPGLRRDYRLGALAPTVSYDSRDNLFTPTDGAFLEATAGLFSPAFGGDDSFQRVDVVAMRYLPLGRTLTFGAKAGFGGSYGDMPFYLRPFVVLRGAQAMRYQGDTAAQVEAELRWQFWERFSVVGFAGAGAAWIDSGRFARRNDVVTGGAGVRYEIARKYGLHMGLDVAFGPDAPILYVQFGSAWMRP